MASIIGSYLNAEFVINMGGQWNLYKHNDVVEKYYFLKKNRNNGSHSKWFDLSLQLVSNKTPIFYFFGAKNEMDVRQMKCAEKLENVYPIAINSQNHAPSVSTEPYLRLLFAGEKNIHEIYLINRNNVVDILELEKQINSLIELPTGLKINLIQTAEQKRKAYLDLLYEWIKVEQNNYTKKAMRSNPQTIAIWGKGRYSSLLIKDLERKGLRVSCIIESFPSVKDYEGLPVIGIDELPDGIDMIIVVPYYDIENIKEKVYKYYTDITVIGIDEFIKQK